MKPRSRVFRTRGSRALPAAAVRTVCAAVRAGGVVVFPTDTVYGIGASAGDREACGRIYALKGRHPRKPLPILIDSLQAARRWVRLGSTALALARRHWPGPLTLVLPPTPQGRRLLAPGARTLAVRVPAHPVALRLLAASGLPWAVTSANRSGRPAVSDGAGAVRQFRGRVAVIVDAGRTGGTESTVAEVRGARMRVLRAGTLTREELAAR